MADVMRVEYANASYLQYLPNGTSKISDVSRQLEGRLKESVECNSPNYKNIILNVIDSEGKFSSHELRILMKYTKFIQSRSKELYVIGNEETYLNLKNTVAGKKGLVQVFNGVESFMKEKPGLMPKVESDLVRIQIKLAKNMAN